MPRAPSPATVRWRWTCRRRCDALVRYLTALRDGTRAAIAAGVGITAATATVARSERPRWTLFDDYNPRNVTEAYRELEWE